MVSVVNPGTPGATSRRRGGGVRRLVVQASPVALFTQGKESEGDGRELGGARFPRMLCRLDSPDSVPRGIIATGAEMIVLDGWSESSPIFCVGPLYRYGKVLVFEFTMK